jgi:hypothetical protein
MTASAHAAERHRTQQTEPLPQTERRFALRALFDRAPGVISEGPDGITVGPLAVNVIVARIDKDGKLVKACVDNEESARRFLEAPVGRVAGSRAQEK